MSSDSAEAQWSIGGEFVSQDDFTAHMERLPLFMDNEKEQSVGNDAYAAIQAIRDECTPREMLATYKESGNDAYKIGQHRYLDAIEYYSLALQHAENLLAEEDPDHPLHAEAMERVREREEKLAQNSDDEDEDIDIDQTPAPQLVSTVYSNRALVHLRMQNYGRCFNDCVNALKLNADNIKAMYFAAKACMALTKPQEALVFLHRACALFPDKREVVALRDSAQAAVEKDERRKVRQEVDKQADAERKATLDRVIREHGVKEAEGTLFDLSHYQPTVQYDADADTLHWPVLLVYDEYEQTDFIAACSEQHRLVDHLSQMFPPHGALAPWDTKNAYTLPKIEVYFRDERRGKYIRVNPKLRLKKILCMQDLHVHDRVPVFYIVSKGSNAFRKKWLQS
ncbi:MAG: hypothetical protein MHM6MM_004384 [Cercozoa sp. M6MM]